MISVIVPMYNLQDYVVRTLNSILAQTYQALEIIVVNDGSTDNSGYLLDAWAAEHPDRVRVIHIPNGGVTNARLTGVRAARGEWIGFVDGDDLIDPEMYQRLMDNASHFGADISHCGYQMEFSDGRVHYFHNTGKIMEQDTMSGLRDLLTGDMVEPGLCNKLYRRRLFDEILQNPAVLADIRINEDLLMNFYLFRNADKSVFEDICPYHYLVRQGSATRQKLNPATLYDPIRVKERILGEAPADLLTLAQRAYLSTCVDTCNRIVASGQRELKAEFVRIRENVIAHYGWKDLLSQKQRMLVILLRYSPWLYRFVYRCYDTWFMKNPYV